MTSYQGQIYIDIPFEPSSDEYKSLEAFLSSDKNAQNGHIFLSFSPPPEKEENPAHWVSQVNRCRTLILSNIAVSWLNLRYPISAASVLVCQRISKWVAMICFILSQIGNKNDFAVLMFSAWAFLGCMTTSTPNVAVTGRDEVHQMSRQEIITASIECSDAGMRPQLVTASRKINNRPTLLWLMWPAIRNTNIDSISWKFSRNIGLDVLCNNAVK